MTAVDKPHNFPELSFLGRAGNRSRNRDRSRRLNRNRSSLGLSERLGVGNRLLRQTHMVISWAWNRGSLVDRDLSLGEWALRLRALALKLMALIGRQHGDSLGQVTENG
jgi:hypothetical protein